MSQMDGCFFFFLIVFRIDERARACHEALPGRALIKTFEETGGRPPQLFLRLAPGLRCTRWGGLDQSKHVNISKVIPNLIIMILITTADP